MENETCKELMYQWEHLCRERERKENLRPGCVAVKVSHMLVPLPSWYAAPSYCKGKRFKTPNILNAKAPYINVRAGN